MRGSYLAVALATTILPTLAQNSSDPCQEVANQQTKASAETTSENPYNLGFKALFDAEKAYQCSLSIPIENEKAVSVLTYLKEMLSMYSSLAFLKNPPKSYQQPAIDVLSRVDDMMTKAKNGSYKTFNEYQLDWSEISTAAHDTHFGVTNGPSPFHWILPDDIVSVSVDGKALPQVYAYSDIANSVSTASPIVELDGQPVFSYLQTYLQKKIATGRLDPHAEWNALMYSAANLFSAWGAEAVGPDMNYGGFRSTNTYNGPSIKGKFANGTEFEWKYQAASHTDFKLAQIASGQEFYDNLILAKTTDDEETAEEMRKRQFDDQTTPSFPTSVPYPSYPKNPIVVQANFTRGGTVSGYFLSENSTGVLSLPSFNGNVKNHTSSALGFNAAVGHFIRQCREAGTKKIVIDLTGNGGGFIYLGYDTFRQFFPKKDPEAWTRSRATPYWNTYGSIASGLQPEDRQIQSLAGFSGAVDLNSSNILSLESKRWSSWKDYYGPIDINHDKFTHPFKFDFSVEGVIKALGFEITGYGNNKRSYDQAFPSEDIIIVYDGACGSTCSIFANLMKNVGRVKSIAVGGIPQNGPMQGVAGTRGSQVRKASEMSGISLGMKSGLLDSGNQTNAAVRSKLNVTVEEIEALPSAQGLPWAGVEAALNTLDAVTKTKQDVPYQFVYEAANCRLFYTMDMIRDVTKLWEAAAKVAGGDTSACVTGSVDGPGSDVDGWLVDSPGFSNAEIWGNANSTKLLGQGKESEGGGRSSAPGMRVSLSLSVVLLTVLCIV